jgi:hypothetical protein
MNFEATYSRMDNDELLRLTSQWATLTEPAQVALAAEMEKRKLGNEFKAERQIALEKPTSPSRNRLRTTWLVLIAIAVGALTGFLKYMEQNPTAAASERYNGSDFTMTVPAGSSPVKVKNSTQPVGEQQMVRNAYSFRNGSASYAFDAYEYSKGAENTPEETLRATASAVFNPGYTSNFFNSRLGALSAAACELEGTTIKGKAAFIRIRAALSEDRKRMWMVIVTASDRQSFPTAQAEEFMNSIELESQSGPRL